MTKPPTSVRSIRLADEAWIWLSEQAVSRDTSVNALVAGLVELARNPPKPGEIKATLAFAEKALAETPPGKPAGTAIRVAGPALMERKRFNPQPKPTKKR